jgi:hypothetical protein
MQYLKPEFQKINGGRPPLTANFAPPPAEERQTECKIIASHGDVKIDGGRKVHEIHRAKV